MCPCLSSRIKYATCSRFGGGLMVPSLFERTNYCLGLYELCPLFSPAEVGGHENPRIGDYILAGIGHEEYIPANLRIDA